MASDLQQFIQAKVFGYPYMPRDSKEFILYISIFYNHYSSWLISQFKSNYFSTTYGLIFLVRDLIFVTVSYHYLIKFYRTLVGHGLLKTLKLSINFALKKLFEFFLALPPVKSKVNKELSKTIEKIHTSLVKNNDSLLQFPQLPNEGLTHDKILKELDNLQELEHTLWDKGRVSGAVYHGGDKLLQLQSEAYTKYSIANQLHPDVFPGVRKMEAEVVSMVLNIFNAPESGCGSTTSGGTESLLLAGLAAREYGKLKKGIKEPEVIAPVTIHAGIEKACYYFGMKLHKVDLDPITYQVDLSKVKRLINSNTVLLVGSAPNFPHGIIDDIEGLSKLALKYNIPLHVDACLGSFIVSFLEKSRIYDLVPLFDFRVPGVTSISCDTHKYGFAPKGSSIIMYRNKELRRCQYYVSSDWTGGMYGSPTLAGSRPGALMVGCWATLVSIGEYGYTEYCRKIVGTMNKVKKEIETNDKLNKYIEIIGNPIGSVVSFKSKLDTFSVYRLGDLLTERGWHFSSLQNPAALHFAFTWLTVPIVDELIADLIECTELASQVNDINESETAALYGVAGSVKTVGVADKLIEAFLDTLYAL